MLTDAELLKQIQHYAIELRWQGDWPFDYSGELSVAAISLRRGGKWSAYRPSVAEAVEECLRINELEIV